MKQIFLVLLIVFLYCGYVHPKLPGKSVYPDLSRKYVRTNLLRKHVDPNLGRKQVIGARPVGFFSNFMAALNMLGWCERHKMIPVIYWDRKFPYRYPNEQDGVGNAWEYYFKPVSGMRYENGDRVYRRSLAPDGLGFNYRPRECSKLLLQKYWGNALIKKYVVIKEHIQKKVDLFVEKHFKGKKVIGIHLRGTDKRQEVKPVAPEVIFHTANQFKGYAFFVATDEQRLLDLALKSLNGPVIYYDAYRSGSKKPVHVDGCTPERGEEVLIEVLLLSKCDKLIHTCSNVSCAAIFFNPSLEHILLEPPQ